jgi:hypothetical protein
VQSILVKTSAKAHMAKPNVEKEHFLKRKCYHTHINARAIYAQRHTSTHIPHTPTHIPHFSKHIPDKGNDKIVMVKVMAKKKRQISNDESNNNIFFKKCSFSTLSFS